MKILLHNASAIDCSEKLLQTLFSTVAGQQIHFTRESSSFEQALLKYRQDTPTVVVQVCSLADIAAVKQLGDILDDHFLAVVAGGKDQKILAECRKLYPRLLIHDEKDFELLETVIKKRLITGQST